MRFQGRFLLKLSRFLVGSLVLLIFIAATASLASVVVAQIQGEGWLDPINLSLSGGSDKPLIMSDDQGHPHVFWQDVVHSFAYTHHDGQSWLEPELVEVPFGTRRYFPDLDEDAPTPLFVPVLEADSDGNLHALWIDDAQAVYYSQVEVESIDDFETWLPRQQLAESALMVALAVGESGDVHVAYLRSISSEEAPSGIYYMKSSDDGLTWTSPTLLYNSPYFRSLPVERANVDLIIIGEDQVTVAWDNPALERVFVVHSGDGGANWEPTIEVDRHLAEDGVGALGPQNIQLQAAGQEAHLAWQGGHDGLSCAQYHQWSADGGVNWRARQRILEAIEGCVESFQLVTNPDSTLSILAEGESGVFLSGWNGVQWSDAAVQPALSEFSDPETFRPVDFSCQHAEVTGVNSRDAAFMVVGCDASEGEDIWLRSRPFTSLESLFAPPVTPVWQPSEELALVDDLSDPMLIADADGFLHAFWVESFDETNTATSITYSRWDGATWSLPRPVLQTPDSGSVERMSVTLDPTSRLLVAWSGGGDIYFSQATTARALSTADWSSPAALPVPRLAAMSPDIAIDRVGVIYIAYAVPLNEDRGIFMVQSGNAGATWLGPVQVFDGGQAGWDMVDRPRLAIGADDTLHLLWTRYGLPPDTTPRATVYSRSDDGGTTWSEPEEMVAASVTWTDILAVGEREVHRFWQEVEGGLWHQVSLDGGLTWGQAQRITGLGGESGPAAVTLDGAGQPILLQAAASPETTAVGSSAEPAEMQHWTWTDSRWNPSEKLVMNVPRADSLSAAVAAGNRLSSIYAGPADDPETGETRTGIYTTNRLVDLPLVLPTPLPTLTPTPPPAATATPLPQVEPTPTVFFPVEEEQGGGLGLPIDTSDPLTGTLLGVVPAAIVVLVAVFIGLRLFRRS